MALCIVSMVVGNVVPPSSVSVVPTELYNVTSKNTVTLLTRACF
jgi:hypothetical protein